MAIKVLIVITLAVAVDAGNEYHGDQTKMTATPEIITDGTPMLKVWCQVSFKGEHRHDEVASMAIAKKTDKSSFDLIEISQNKPSTVFKRKGVKGIPTGHIFVNKGKGFIELKFMKPKADVAGRYICITRILDKRGNPRIQKLFAHVSYHSKAKGPSKGHDNRLHTNTAKP